MCCGFAAWHSPRCEAIICHRNTQLLYLVPKQGPYVGNISKALAKFITKLRTKPPQMSLQSKYLVIGKPG